MKNIISTIGAILLIVVFLWLGIKLPDPKTDTPKKEAAETPPAIEFVAPRAEAKKVITSATTSPKTLNAKIINLAAYFGNADGGVCYRLADNDGDGFTFLIANNGIITGSLTCDP